VPSVLRQHDSTIVLLPSRELGMNVGFQMAETLLMGRGSMSQMYVDCGE
jgi:hypothetical protein